VKLECSIEINTPASGTVVSYSGTIISGGNRRSSQAPRARASYKSTVHVLFAFLPHVTPAKLTKASGTLSLWVLLLPSSPRNTASVPERVCSCSKSCFSCSTLSAVPALTLNHGQLYSHQRSRLVKPCPTSFPKL